MSGEFAYKVISKIDNFNFGLSVSSVPKEIKSARLEVIQMHTIISDVFKAADAFADSSEVALHDKIDPQTQLLKAPAISSKKRIFWVK